MSEAHHLPRPPNESPEAGALLGPGPVLLFDGECGVCSRSVQWILKHERQTTLRFCALKSAPGRLLTAEARVPRDVDSLLWVERLGERVVVHKWSGAVLEALAYVGGPWKLLTVMRYVPRPLRDLAYRFFARHRLDVAAPHCLIPSQETRARFLGT